MSTFFTADLHFGHANLILRERKFPTVEEHDELIIRNWNKMVTKRDKVFILGDVAMENHKHYHLLDRLLGLKTVVGGNHDLEKDIKYLLEHVDKVIGCIDYKGFCVTHMPVHRSEVMGFYRGNIHGHTHEKHIEDKLYFNVCLDARGFRPVPFEYIEKLYNER